MTSFKNYKRKTVVLTDGSKFRYNGHRWVNYMTKETLNDDDLARLLSRENRSPNEEMFHIPSGKEPKIKPSVQKQKKPKKKAVKESSQIKGVLNPKNITNIIDKDRYLSELASLVHCEVRDLKSLNSSSNNDDCVMMTSDGDAIPIVHDASWRLMGHFVEQDLREIIGEIKAIDEQSKLLGPIKRLEKLADNYCGILHILVSAFDSSLLGSNKIEEHF